MAIVVNEPEFVGIPEMLGRGLGAGLGAGLQKGADLALERALEQRDREAFQQKLQTLQKADSLESAIRMIVSGGLASNPDELIKLAATAREMFPDQQGEQERFDTQVVDEDSGAVFTLKLTADEINNPEVLKKSFPGRNFRLASEGEKKPIDWYDANGNFIRRSVKRPPGGMPKDALQLRAAQAEGGGKSDILDPTGKLKNETTNAIRRIAISHLTETDAQGNPLTRPDPKVLSFVLDRAAELVRSGEAPDPIPATVRALNEATDRFGDVVRNVPISAKTREQLLDRTFAYEEAVDLLDRVFFKLPKAIGLGSAARQLWNYITGNIPWPGGITFPRTAKARAELATLSRMLQAAFANNERIPIYEQELNRQMIPTPNEWFTAPEVAAKKLRALRETAIERRRFATKRLGVQAPSMPTLADRIRVMPVEDLADIDVNMLSEDEKKALTERLNQLGY